MSTTLVSGHIDGGTAKGFATKFANKAGKMIQERFECGIKSGMNVALKPDRTLVTATDKEINRLFIEEVRKCWPTHNVLGEEESSVTKKGFYTWVLDPVDGTFCFARGIPTCVISVALVAGGTPIVGAVYHPSSDSMFHAEKGRGSFINDKEIHVSEGGFDRADIGLCTWPGSRQANLSGLHVKINEKGAFVFSLGSLAYMNALVSNGTFLASIHPSKSAVDSAAAVIIVREAGGKVTSMLGVDQRYDEPIEGCIFSNGKVHDELVEMVRGELGLDGGVPVLV